MLRSIRRLSLSLLAFAAIGGLAYWDSNRVIKDKGDNISDYSAIFITNGQVYFGKIHGENDKYLDLRDVYYLKFDNLSDLEKTKAETQNPNITLFKLGDELHGPNDRLRIYNDQIQFTESLRDDSQVVSAIGKHKETAK